MRRKFNGKLFFKTLTRFVLGVFFVGLILFIPAGTLSFRYAWLFLGALFIPMFFVLIYLVINDPDLLEKRMKTKEREESQKVYVLLSILVSIATYVIPGLDFRFHWSAVPDWVVLLSTLLMITGYFLFFMVMKQNSYASRVIEIQEDQKLIDTGLYSIVRHPMYFAATVLYFFSPLVLGSFYAMIPMIFMPVLLIIRINNEEKVLLKGLKGYDLYMKKVKYRLLPFIW